MNSTEQQISSNDGVSYYSIKWLPEGTPLGVIAFLHGHGDHSRRYDDWFAGFTKAGWAVFAIDYRGHGQTSGKRGVIKKFSQFLEDAALLMTLTRQQFDGLPVILYGHSMGATITLQYLLNSTLLPDLAIASSPWLRLQRPPGNWMRLLIRTLDKIGPSLTMKTGLRSSDFSSAEGFAEKREKDNWVHNRISARLFSEVERTSEELLSAQYSFPVPVLLLQGDADRITRPDAAEELASLSKPVKLVKWAGGDHQLHNCSNRAELQIHIINWINSTLCQDSEQR